MSKKSSLQRTGDLAKNIQAIRKIILAAIRGGWTGAAIEALKHYWPQILTAAIALLMLPIIIFCSLPAVFFGLDGSDTENTASAAREIYDGYEQYCNEYLQKLVKEISQPETSQTESVVWKTELTGKRMDKSWFIVFHAVETGNDLSKISEESIKAQIPRIFTYEVKDKEPDESSSDTASAGTTHEPETSGKPAKLLIVHSLSPEEYMTVHSYSEGDKNRAELMMRVLKEQEKTVSSDMG